MQDYSEKFVSKLTGQFVDSPKLQGMVKAIMDALTELETQADELTTDRWIETAIGQQLDGCGYIVGEARAGRDDETYRAALRFRVSVNIANGTPKSLIQALKYLTSPLDCQYLEAYPATAILFTNGMTVPENIQAQIQAMSPAGISDVPVMVGYGQKPFRFSRAPIPGELFVNDNYLSVNDSDLQVSEGAFVGENSATLGGLIPSRLMVNGAFLSIGTKTLAVYNRNTVTLLGTDHLTGVYQ